MKETEITCLSQTLKIPDLGLTMVKGQVEHVEASRASQSKDLALVRRGGGVAVKEVRRSRQTRKASQVAGPRPRLRDFVREEPVSGPPTPPPSTVTPGPITVQGVVDLAGVRQVVREEVTGALKEAFLSGRGPVSMGYHVTAPKVDPTPDTPAFIPDKILQDGVKADIQVEATESEAGGVDAATKALKTRKKAAKKKAPRKKKAAKKKAVKKKVPRKKAGK